MNYQILKTVQWTPTSSQSQLLTEAGFKHGFSGCGVSKPMDLHHVKQVHGTQIIEAHGETTASGAQTRADGDAIWTQDPLVCVAVKTADCLPVLLADTKNRRVMAMHAGWRGLCAGILGQGVARLKALGSDPVHLVAAIGPSISRERYEVGEEVIAALYQGKVGLQESQAALASAKGRSDRWHLDLKVAAVFTFINAGLSPGHIEAIAACTYSEPIWHSYRREGPGCGSNWSWISP